MSRRRAASCGSIPAAPRAAAERSLITGAQAPSRFEHLALARTAAYRAASAADPAPGRVPPRAHGTGRPRPTALRRARGRTLRPAWIAALAATAGCASLEHDAERRLDVFDTYWRALANDYPYFGRNHVDWEELRAQYRSAAVYARRPAEFYHLLAGMLSQLHDPHVSLTIPAANWREGGVGATSVDDLPGFERFVLEGRIFVTSWPRGHEPLLPDHLEDGARQMPEIVRVENVPVVWPMVENLLLGPPGSAAELTLRWTDGTLSRHVLRRPMAPEAVLALWRAENPRAVRASMPAPAAGLDLSAAASLERVGRFSILRLKTLSGARLRADQHDDLPRHLDALVDQAMDCEGLILDLRDNGGGEYDTTRALAGRFLSHTAVQVLPEQRAGSFLGLLDRSVFPHVQWAPRPPVFDKPLVVFTSWRTGSAAEHLARLLQTECGAVVIGQRTIGAEAAIHSVEGPDGSLLQFGGTRLLDTRGHGFQGEGVVPDIVVRLSLEDVERAGSFAAAHAAWEERLMRNARRVLER